jgi:amicyanin
MQGLRPERRPRPSGAVFLVAAFVVATLSLPGTASAEDAAVKIDNFSFSPPSLTVKAGTTVTWRNKDDIPHTVASSGRLFKSQALDTDDSYSFTFNEPGSYQYFCSLHPHMTAKIVVEPANHAAK